MPIGKIIPKFDGKSAKHMNIHSPTLGIVFHVIAESRRRRCHIGETLKQGPMFTRPEHSKRIQNINGNEQP